MFFQAFRDFNKTVEKEENLVKVARREEDGVLRWGRAALAGLSGGSGENRAACSPCALPVPHGNRGGVRRKAAGP